MSSKHGRAVDTSRRARAHTTEGKGEGTRLVDAERGLAVLLAVLRALREWRCFEQGSERLLRDIARVLGLEAGALWLPHGDELVASTIWSAPNIEHTTLENVLRLVRFSQGVGVPGRVWLHREPIHRAISIADDSPQQGDFVLDGLYSCVAFPALAGEEVLGVLELYSAAPVELSERLREVLTAVGYAVGSFFARRRGELKLSPLTARELEVLTLSALGLTTRTVAERLSISRATVKTHFEHIYAKLGVTDRTSAVAYALRAGLLE